MTAEPSIISAWRSVQRAIAAGLSASVLLVLDSPDAATTNVAARWTNRSTVDTVIDSVTVHEGDLGAARNAATAHTAASWLAFLDADDLWGEHWLVLAHTAATSQPSGIYDVFHPQVNIIFGDHHSLLHHIDSESPDFRWSRFCLHNAWTALSFVRRELLTELPYPRNDLDSGFGYEDWSWNMAVLDSGGRHHAVENTCHFIKRINGDSLLAASQQALRTRYPDVPAPQRTSPAPAPKPTPDPGTHVVAPIDLASEIFDQITLAGTIEPAVTETISGRGAPRSLPQNFNTHNTAAQFALEELWRLRTPNATIGEICERSPQLASLHAEDRLSVVAEFVLSEKLLGRTVGESVAITEATTALSQLSSAP